MKGRVKEDSAFKFYEQESSWKATIHKAWPIITHDPRPITHEARRTTPKQPTHPPTHTN